jgi:hypothetical protein
MKRKADWEKINTGKMIKLEERSTVVGNLNASLLGQEIKVVNRSFFWFREKSC